MTAKEIVEELKALGSESIKKVLRNLDVQEPFFGVKIGDMKPIQKRRENGVSSFFAPKKQGKWCQFFFRPEKRTDTIHSPEKRTDTIHSP